MRGETAEKGQLCRMEVHRPLGEGRESKKKKKKFSLLPSQINLC